MALSVLVLGFPVLAQAHARTHVSPGHLVLSWRQSEEECRLMMNGRRGEVPFKPAYPRNFSLDGKTLEPGHRLLLACGRDSLGEPTMIGDVDLNSGAVLWRRPMHSADGYTASNRFLFEFSRHRTPASEFQSKRSGIRLTAISTKTGMIAWSAPFPTVRDGNFAQPGEVIESPSGPIGSSPAFVFLNEGTTAFDARGKLLWHRDSGPYSGGGIYAGFGQLLFGAVIGEEDREGEGQIIKAVDPQTEAIHWELPLADPCYGREIRTAGAFAFEFGSDCTVEFNLETGALGHDVRYPASWNSTAADASAVASFDGSDLALYALGDLAHPIWSRPADGAVPLLLTPEHLLVGSPSGVLLLDSSDGRTVAKVAEPQMWNPEAQGPVEGMIASVDGAGVPVVLRLDRH